MNILKKIFYIRNKGFRRLCLVLSILLTLLVIGYSCYEIFAGYSSIETAKRLQSEGYQVSVDTEYPNFIKRILPIIITISLLTPYLIMIVLQWLFFVIRGVYKGFKDKE